MSKLTRLFEDLSNRAANGTRKAGKFYLDNRDRIDAGALAYPLAQNAAKTAIARSIATKTVFGIGAGALAVKALPFAAAGAAIYYGPDLVKKAKSFMAQGEQVKKASKGDFTSIRGLADQLAERVTREDEKPSSIEKIKDVPEAANDPRPPSPDM